MGGHKIDSIQDVLKLVFRGEVVEVHPRPAGLDPFQARHDLARESLALLVFDAEGALIATVPTPVGFVPHTAEGDLVWGVHRDELHVESVRAYALTRR